MLRYGTVWYGMAWSKILAVCDCDTSWHLKHETISNSSIQHRAMEYNASVLRALGLLAGAVGRLEGLVRCKVLRRRIGMLLVRFGPRRV